MDVLPQTLTPSPPPAFLTSTAPLPAKAKQPLGLSVIIPSHNGLARLIPLLRSLVQTAIEAGRQGRLEILVQDDASTEFDARLCLMPPAVVAVNERNLGFAATCNAGAERAQGDVLLFLNQDTRALGEWFEPIVSMFDDPRVGIVGPKLLFPDGSVQSVGGLYDAGKGPFHRCLGWSNPADPRLNRRERVSWTTGAALAIRRELFAQVGGFDTGYVRGYFEDVDLCERVKAAGLEVWYCPEEIGRASCRERV